MRSKAEYRSAIRSRKMIKTAFVELMQEREWQKITVTDIINRCDLNRGTFYAHFSNVRAVLEQIENDLVNALSELIDATDILHIKSEPMPILLKATTYLENEVEFYKKLSNSRGIEQFSMKFKEMLIHKVINSGKDDIPEENHAAFEIAVRFLIGGFVSLYLDWFRGRIDGTLFDLCMAVDKYMKETLNIYSYGQSSKT